MPTVDVVVVGAGVAGLAAARRVHEAGLRIIVLEARNRIGGRIWTVHDTGLAAPVELGAEFLHGEAEETRELTRAAAIDVYDINGRRWLSRNGKLKPFDDFEQRLTRVFGRMKEDRDPDRPFDEALRAMPNVSRTDRLLARRFVEGFQAADPHLISERSLADSADPESLRIARVGRGYQSVVDSLAAPVQTRIRMRTRVRRITWERGRVVVDARQGRSGTVRLNAGKAIIAVPLGVLQAQAGAGAMVFDPGIPSVERAASKMAMGSVVRVALHFDEPFWTEPAFAARHGAGAFRDMTFIQSLDEQKFPVWWTARPNEAPVLVGWSGGPATREMAGHSPAAIIHEATKALARVLGSSTATIRRRLRGAFTHNWLNDPFANGAYSYIMVGGSASPATLARPVERTLYFAGEHAIAGRNGTVDGAIASGYRAARQILDMND